MKIAFVGKGGSGKSTVSALFTQYLVGQGQRVLAIDADINQHFAQLIGAPFVSEKAISHDSHKTAIRHHLRGTNQRIASPAHMVKTTPPGEGSRFLSIKSTDPLIAKYTTSFAPYGYFMHVGTYGEEGIGTSCYHGNLSIFENVLSHTVTGDKDWVVADMVAGTDAFANSLHALFDTIFMVVEPTPESVGVFKQFAKLAQTAGMHKHVFAIANKVIDEDDRAYLAQHIGDKLVAEIPQEDSLRKLRQQGSSITQVKTTLAEPMQQIADLARAHRPSHSAKLKLLHELHLRYSKGEYAKTTFGDLTGQIDPAFSYERAAIQE